MHGAEFRSAFSLSFLSYDMNVLNFIRCYFWFKHVAVAKILIIVKNGTFLGLLHFFSPFLLMLIKLFFSTHFQILKHSMIIFFIFTGTLESDWLAETAVRHCIWTQCVC